MINTGELADKLLLGIDLEDLGGGAEVAVAEPVHDEGVAVGELADVIDSRHTAGSWA